MTIRILYFSALTRMAGAEKSLFDIVCYFSREDNFSIKVITPYCGEFNIKLDKSGVTNNCLCKKEPSSLLKMILYPIKLFYCILMFRPHIVHLNTKGCIKYLLLSRLLLNFIWLQHIRGNIIPSDNEIYHKEVIKFSDYRIGISKSVKKSYKREDDVNFFIIPNGFKFENFSPPLSEEEKKSFKKSIGIPDNKKLILHVGRFTPLKNQDLIVEVAKDLKNYFFVLCGAPYLGRKTDGEYFKKVLDQANGLENIRFLGWRQDIYKFYSIADLYILPSYSEAFGRTIVEAIYYKKPVLVNDMEAMREIVEDNPDYVMSLEKSEIVKKIEEKFMDYPTTDELAHLKLKIEQKYSFQHSVSLIKSIYVKIFLKKYKRILNAKKK